jgi:hypothetical protein
MEHMSLTRHGRIRSLLAAEIRPDETNPAGIEMRLKVFNPAAAEIIRDRDRGASFHQRIYQMRPDEGGSARDQDGQSLSIQTAAPMQQHSPARDVPDIKAGIKATTGVFILVITIYN